MALPWWQHHKHCLGIIIYYYIINTQMLGQNTCNHLYGGPHYKTCPQNHFLVRSNKHTHTHTHTDSRCKQYQLSLPWTVIKIQHKFRFTLSRTNLAKPVNCQKQRVAESLSFFRRQAVQLLTDFTQMRQLHWAAWNSTCHTTNKYSR